MNIIPNSFKVESGIQITVHCTDDLFWFTYLLYIKENEIYFSYMNEMINITKHYHKLPIEVQAEIGYAFTLKD